VTSVGPSPLEAARGPQEIPDSPACDETAVSLYVLNAAGLTKPHDIEHPTADLSSYATDVATITETHFKTNHSDSVVIIPCYTLWHQHLLTACQLPDSSPH